MSVTQDTILKFQEYQQTLTKVSLVLLVQRDDCMNFGLTLPEQGELADNSASNSVQLVFQLRLFRLESRAIRFGALT